MAFSTGITFLKWKLSLKIIKGLNGFLTHVLNNLNNSRKSKKKINKNSTKSLFTAEDFTTRVFLAIS